MLIFSSDSRGVDVWGPTASVDVKCDALGDIVDDTWVLTNLSIGAKEIIDVRQCFDDLSFIYALGNNQASCHITLVFAVLVGKKNCNSLGAMSAVDEGLDEYVKNRISQNLSGGVISIGKFSRRAWLIGIDIGNVDTAKGVCYGTLTFNMELKK